MFKSINGGILPQRATKYSVGFDVFANEDMVIGAGETKLIGLGIYIDLDPKNTWYMDPTRLYLELHPRSSLRAKGLGGGVGIIDMDYRDEIKIVIHNPITEEHVTWWVDTILNMVGLKPRFNTDATANHRIKKGDKIGQLILSRHEGWLLPDEYTKNDARNGGFGSTGL